MNVEASARPETGARRVVVTDPRADARWETFVRAHPDALIYHHPAWLAVLTREYGRRPIGLVCEDGAGQIRGVLPLLRTAGLPLPGGGALTGRRLASLPRTPLAGPLAADQAALVALLATAVAHVRRRPGTVLQVKAPRPTLDGLVDDLVAVPWRLSYVVDLPARPEALRFGNSRNHARIKWAIHKAARLGVRVRAAEDEADLRAWYASYLETMRHHCVPPRSYRLFRAMWDVLRPRGLMRLLIAEQEAAGARRLLAGSLFLMLNQTVFYAFNGRRAADLALRPNDVILWQALHDACAEGYRHLDLGEVVEGHTSLADFKSKWGAREQRLYRYYYPAPAATPADDEHEGRLRRLANSLWRRLPLPLTALVGDGLYRYL